MDVVHFMHPTLPLFDCPASATIGALIARLRWADEPFLWHLGGLATTLGGFFPWRSGKESVYTLGALMTSILIKTPLHAWHASHGARLVDFAGYSMPVQYTSIVEEHTTARTKAALFDISHMGRFRFFGPQAEAFLDHLVTRRVTNMQEGQIRYALICQEDGGILDDVLVYRLKSQGDGEPWWALVVNACNRNKIADWIDRQITSFDASWEDRTDATAMIAVQGPEAVQSASRVLDFDITSLRYYTGEVREIAGIPGVVSRTGYTGEDGCELVVAAENAVGIWQRLLALGAAPAGLGARDTLRLEAAMPLYGHELSEEINPFQAGLGFAVHGKDRIFIGCEALARCREASDQSVRIGLEINGRRAAREHYPILVSGKRVGEITSGSYSPTLQRPIAMGYVPPEYAKVGTSLQVDLRGRPEEATVVALPFYQRS